MFKYLCIPCCHLIVFFNHRGVLELPKEFIVDDGVYVQNRVLMEEMELMRDFMRARLKIYVRQLVRLHRRVEKMFWRWKGGSRRIWKDSLEMK